MLNTCANKNNNVRKKFETEIQNDDTMIVIRLDLTKLEVKSKIPQLVTNLNCDKQTIPDPIIGIWKE